MTAREAVFASVAAQAETCVSQMRRECQDAKRWPDAWEPALLQHREDALRVAARFHPRELAIAALLAAAEWLARQPEKQEP